MTLHVLHLHCSMMSHVIHLQSSGLKESVSSAGINRPLSGLASLAANLSGKSDSKSGRSDSVSSKSDVIKSSHSKPEQTKTGQVRTEPSKTLLHKEKSDPTTQPSSKSSKSADTVKPAGGIKSFGVDIFKGLKTDPVKPKLSDSSKSSQKLSDQQKSKSSSDSSKYKSSDGSKVVKSSSELVKSGSRSGSIPDLSKSSSKSDSVKQSFKPPSSSSSTSSASSSSASNRGDSGAKGQPGGTSSAVHADKRLQMMKKKAAAKLHDRRTSFK